MKKHSLSLIIALAVLATTGGFAVKWFADRERHEQVHFAHEETELLVSNELTAQTRLYQAGKTLADTTRIAGFNGERMWLRRGNYFLQVTQNREPFFIPAPVYGYRAGPDAAGAIMVTLRPRPKIAPPRLFSTYPEFVFIHSGNFLFGDRLNPREPHYLWLTGYFINPFEVTNAEFREFIADEQGYANDEFWTKSGRRWKASRVSQATAMLQPKDSDYLRFGKPDQPVVWLNWFEASAYCKWLTKRIGQGRWLFALPTETEWEKAARGPGSFDYGLGMQLSDAEISWYNWKKNPDAPVTVVGIQDSYRDYRPNRFGLYHVSGNAAEWMQSINRPYNREQPYADDDRNHDEAAGLRVARGGSWYSASIALLNVSYRDTFQPEHSSQELGFRIVARMLP